MAVRRATVLRLQFIGEAPIPWLAPAAAPLTCLEMPPERQVVGSSRHLRREIPALEDHVGMDDRQCQRIRRIGRPRRIAMAQPLTHHTGHLFLGCRANTGQRFLHLR